MALVTLGSSPASGVATEITDRFLSNVKQIQLYGKYKRNYKVRLWYTHSIKKIIAKLKA